MLSGYLVPNIWYQSKMVLGFGSFRLVILEISLPIFFCQGFKVLNSDF